MMFEHFKNETIVASSIKSVNGLPTVSTDFTEITYLNYMDLLEYEIFVVFGSKNVMNLDFMEAMDEMGVKPPEEVNDTTKTPEEIQDITDRMKTAMLHYKVGRAENYFRDTFGAKQMLIYREGEYLYRIIHDVFSDASNSSLNSFLGMCDGGMNPMDAHQMVLM